MPLQPDLFAHAEPRVYRVHELNEIVRQLLDDGFGEVRVEGEISNARRHASGHWYFTLKDEASQLAAVLFRGMQNGLRFEPENGLQVRAAGRLQLFVPQGKYQLQVRALEPLGQGALELAFRQLRERLQAEGLFDPARKRALPRYPRCIAVVTSMSGAAVRDILTTLGARWPLARVRLVPVAVQGDAAPGEIVRALQAVNRTRAAEVIIVARGGGSLEDLWAFNDERVARAIAASRLPVVSGVGHESDVTIADLVADVRAATPTAAAGAVAPDQNEVRRLLVQSEGRMARGLRRQLELPRARLEALLQRYGMRRLRHWVPEQMQVLDERLDRLLRAATTGLHRCGERQAALLARLVALSPAAILSRGYTYCVDATTGVVVARAAEVRAEQQVHVHFGDGVRDAVFTPSMTSRAEEAT
jgi:exodeoxyribonuclease VII large subunit